ncbi:MAG: dTMP kinase [Steroidobacterales bacterium]
MTRTARFITFEGIEGVGKSTQIAALTAALTERAIAHSVTREPGGTPLAEKIRSLVLDQGLEPLPSSAELLLMFAARAVHLANLIEPELRDGRWVLCDRFTDASYAYQGAGRGLSTAVIATLESFVQGDRRPDLTILLDMPVATALARVRLRNPGAVQDRFETEAAKFFERTRHAYLARAAASPQRIVVIDADQPAADVTRAILAALESKRWIS